MMKRIYALFLTFLLTLTLAVPVLADADYPRLVDDADLLDDEEEESLLQRLDEVSEKQNMDIVIVTIDELGDKTATEYADDFFDYNGYGYGSSRDGILFLVSMETRKWAISTTGEAISVFTDAGQEYMQERFLPELSEGNYYSCFETFIELSDQFITKAYEDEPYDVGNMPPETVSFIWILLDPLIGMGIAFIIASIKKSKLKSIVKQVDAQQYMEPGSMNLTLRDDRFINRHIRTRRIETSSSSSGGSSTHTSSSGTTHGGSSGSF